MVVRVLGVGGADDDIERAVRVVSIAHTAADAGVGGVRASGVTVALLGTERERGSDGGGGAGGDRAPAGGRAVLGAFSVYRISLSTEVSALVLEGVADKLN